MSYIRVYLSLLLSTIGLSEMSEKREAMGEPAKKRRCVEGRGSSEYEESENPGLIFIINETDCHACINLASASQVDASLVQGKIHAATYL